MNPLSLPVALAFVAICASSFAGETRMYRGQSDSHAVEFLDPVDLPNSMMEVSRYVPEDLGYTKKIASIPFKSECRLNEKEIRCTKTGKSPLAGATYRRTRDGTPRCPGQAEDRFTCVSGCGPAAPRYITFSISEC